MVLNREVVLRACFRGLITHPVQFIERPAILARYERQLATLQDALSKGINAEDSEAAEAIRDLVETVAVFWDPARPGGMMVEIAGRLNALLGEQAYPNKVRGVWGKGGSGRGTHPITPLDLGHFTVRRAAG
jgi:hypothetical protein